MQIFLNFVNFYKRFIKSYLRITIYLILYFVKKKFNNVFLTFD